ncbi:hypothetical protein ABZW18_24255 [Streptomyces sp. NPDC004647]|uniref:hypothetical protein n=1 Tax=Streptomyces sp. NPDC004647 TaxID=3154671 RepID=UPI0033B54580
MVSATLLMACAAATAGCAGGTDGGTNDRGRRPVPRSAQAQDDLLRGAESALVRRCLAEKELKLPQAPGGNAGPGGAKNGAGTSQREFPYGIEDSAWAAEHGFGLDTPRTSSRQGDTARSGHLRKGAGDRPDTGPDTAARQRELSDAMFGSGKRELSARTATGHLIKANSDGCLAQAQRTLYGDQKGWFRTQVTVNNLGAETHQRVTDDPAYSTALARWSQCVQPVQQAEDPDELRRIWQRRARALAPEQAERLQRQFAVAEARCVGNTGLARTGERLERRHGAEVRAAHAELLAEHRRMRERGLRIAARNAG